MFSEEKNLVDTIHEILSRGRILLEKGEYQAALKLIQPFREQKKLPLVDRLAFLLMESKLKAKQMAAEKGLMLVDEILQMANELETPLLIVDALAVKAELYWLSGKFDGGLVTIERGETLLAKTKPKVIDEKQIKQRKGELLHQKGIIYWFKGDLDKALDCHQQSLIINKALGNKRATADALNNIGLAFYSKGDLDQALEYHRQSLELREKQNNRREIASSLSNLGIVCSLKGNLDQALKYHQHPSQAPSNESHDA